MGSSSSLLLEAVDLTHSYGETRVLNGVNAGFEAGTTTALIGPSGCGKSTLIRALIGLVRPQAGEVRYRGEAVMAGDWPGLRLRVGYVIQEGGLFPHLSCRENVLLMPRELGWERDRQEARLAELAALAHLSPGLLDRYPTELSGGQRQRVSLVRALMLDPEILLLDEPLGALDPIIRRELQEELRAIFLRLRKTVVLVTHDLAEAGYLGNRLLLLRAGGIEQAGSLKELVMSPATDFTRQFVSAQRGLSIEGIS